jgi:GntR family transcriptional regulator of vanillate catabolism
MSESTDSVSVVATLRRLILEGRFAPGERLAEIPVARMLGVSRTPVRLALRTLEQEGLLAKAGKRGVVVRAFSHADVLCAVEVRGVLEGLAAARLARRGLGDAERAVLRECVDSGEHVLIKGYLVESDIAQWSQLNARFHGAILAADDSRVIADAIARNDHLPFASADSIVIDREALDREYRKLQVAQLQHQLVVDALEHGESGRVEQLMREHAYVGIRYGPLFGLPAFAHGTAPSADLGPGTRVRRAATPMPPGRR